MLKNFIVLGSLAVVSLTAINAEAGLVNKDEPHFYVKMENQSDKDASISLQQGVGNVYFTPNLVDHTALPAHQKSQRYGVTFAPIDPSSTFNVVFTGQNDCAFNIASYSPGIPKVTMSGPGCHGGGYKFVEEADGRSLLLYISDIRVSAKK